MSSALLKSGAALVGALALVKLSRRFDLKGRVAIVTGGSRGLGLELARELLRRGAKVAICARDEVELEHAREELARLGPVLAMRVDLEQREEVENFARAVAHGLGPVEVLVNNAGVIQVGPAEEMTVEDYEHSLRTHLYGPLWLTHAVLPSMRARREGRIVNISSVGGKLAVPHLLPYCVGKFALTGFSQGLRSELAKSGIKVTTVCPGLMRTGSPRNADFKGQHRREYLLFKSSASTPLLTISCARAARRIVRALIYGRAELMFARASLAARLHGLFPGLVQDALGLLNRALPGPGGIGHGHEKGYRSETTLSKVLGTLSDRAALENNEAFVRP